MGNRRDLSIKNYRNSIEFIKTSRYPYILVEGLNDISVYESVQEKNWQITIPEIPRENIGDRSVKNSIMTVIRDYNTTNNYKNVRIGIVDRDYDPKERLDNLFYTDKNDIESTAIQILTEAESYEIFPPRLKLSCNREKFCKIYNDTKKISQELSNLWKHIHDYNIAHNTNISYLINNYKDNEQALLNDIIIKNSNTSSYVIDYQRLLNLYKLKSTNDYIKTMNVSFLESIMHIQSGHFRGHDFFHILVYLILKETNISASGVSELEKEYMKKSIEKDWIKRTNLYQDVKDTGAFK
jgi:hypothetical protein